MRHSIRSMVTLALGLGISVPALAAIRQELNRVGPALESASIIAVEVTIPYECEQTAGYLTKDVTVVQNRPWGDIYVNTRINQVNQPGRSGSCRFPRTIAYLATEPGDFQHVPPHNKVVSITGGKYRLHLNYEIQGILEVSVDPKGRHRFFPLRGDIMTPSGFVSRN